MVRVVGLLLTGTCGSIVSLGNIEYSVVTTKSFDKALSKLPANWQKRIVAKIKEVAVSPYAMNNNVMKLQGRPGYRLRVGDWRIIYELEDDRLVMLVLQVGTRGGIY